tara:strand:- start:1583 stop:2077 length:495 start_codon:yes stop_codon:yes gene_type:complete
MNDNNNDFVYNTIMQMTKTIEDVNGDPIEIPVLNRSMSCHIYAVNNKEELLEKLNRLSFVEYVRTVDNDNWIVVCKVKDVRKNPFAQIWSFNNGKYAGNTMAVIQFMKEGAYELLQGEIRKVSLINHDDERVLKENDIEELFGINIEERLKEEEYYLMFELSFN